MVQRPRRFNDVEIVGDMAYLSLTKRNGELVAKTSVSVADLPRLREFGLRWYSCPNGSGHHYAQLRMATQEGSKVYMLHRFLLDAPKGVLVDHINGDTLDNRRENLRLVTPSQNCQNRRPDKDSSTGIKNVCWDKTTRKYRVYLMIKGKNRNIGYYGTLEEAERAAKAARLLYHSHSPDHTKPA